MRSAQENIFIEFVVTVQHLRLGMLRIPRCLDHPRNMSNNQSVNKFLPEFHSYFMGAE